MNNFVILAIFVFGVFGIIMAAIGCWAFFEDIEKLGKIIFGGFVVIGVCIFGVCAYTLSNHFFKSPAKNKVSVDISSADTSGNNLSKHEILFEPYITDNPDIVTFGSVSPGFLRLKSNQVGKFYCSFFDDNKNPVPAILNFKFSLIESKEYFDIDICQCEDGRNLVTVYPLKEDSSQIIFLYSKNQMYAAEVLLATREATDGYS